MDPSEQDPHKNYDTTEIIHMDYTEAIAYYHNIPPFIPRQTAPGESLFDLRLIGLLLDELDHPERSLRFVHVAGSNGKGSTCAFLLSILTAAGYKAGLFTSPMLESFADQFRIGRQLISENAIARHLTSVREASERIAARGEGTPSGFEQLTAMALLCFKEMHCDPVILETGLGGRLDATNIIPAPLLSVITPITLEHTQVLGDTLAQIAREKAGIIKQGSSAVLSAPQPLEAASVIRNAAEDRRVPHYTGELPEQAADRDLTGQSFFLPEFCGLKLETPLKTSLLGSYQIRNAALAADAAILLMRAGLDRISAAAITEGIETAEWPGRFELLRTDPYFIVDGSHNPQGAESLRESLDSLFPGRRIIFIAGILADKECEKILAPLLPLAQQFLTITPDSPRAMPAEQLAEAIREAGGSAQSCPSAKAAVERALVLTPSDGVICAFGSLYSIDRLKNALNT